MEETSLEQIAVMEEVPLEQSWWCEDAEVVFMVRLQNARGGQHIKRQTMKKWLESKK